MAQDNPPTPAPDAPEPSSNPPRKRRRGLKILGVIVVLLILLVVLLPTIAGLGFVRGIVVGKINQNLDGKLEIDHWSLGWTSGIVMRGVRLLDERGEKIAVIDKVSTQLSLIGAMRGKYDLGKTTVDGCEFWVKLDKEGQSNVAKLPKKKHAPKEQPQTAQAELPNVTGDFTIHAKGQIEVPDQPIARVRSADITATITDMNQPIPHHADIETGIGDAPAGKITVDGKLPAQALINFANNKAPGQTGSTDIAWTMPNLQPVVTQLKGAVAFLPDVT